ncbi:MAG TPA: N-acetylmuramoyl-L-alanine amidase [Thermomicrobiales bacterium]|nr:N-acetylmuramoyl-L-alanine amidase [Thermomicrobiales bacterium]
MAAMGARAVLRRGGARLRLAAACAALLLAALAPTAAPAGAAGGAADRALWAARVGLQVGHWHIEDLPDEQAARLRGQTGGSGGGYREVDVNLAVVTRLAPLLEARGITVDILPARVPAGYRADLFLAVHCDANPDPAARGYKVARYAASPDPARDDALVAALSAAYAAATDLPRDPTITRGMAFYYAYNRLRYETVIGRETAGAIVELGFLTNPADRALLVAHQDLVARALADGIVRYLTRPGALPPALPPGAALTPCAPSDACPPDGDDPPRPPTWAAYLEP